MGSFAPIKVLYCVLCLRRSLSILASCGEILKIWLGDRTVCRIMIRDRVIFQPLHTDTAFIVVGMCETVHGVAATSDGPIVPIS